MTSAPPVSPVSPVRVVYSDLDGTMFGARGSFFADDAGVPTLEPARALVALHEAGIALVPVSGRTRAQLVEAARILGADGFIGEMGALVGWDGGQQVSLRRGAMPEHLPGTPMDVMRSAGLPEAMFAHWSGRLEWHSPWHAGHEADLMLRGNLPLDEVHAWLAANGWDWLEVQDNGVLPRRELPDGTADPVHIYHVLPAGIGKGDAVAWDLARRGLGAEAAVAIGDSLTDLGMAAHVGCFHLVANGADAPGTAAAAAGMSNVVTTGAPVGIGWAEAVRAAVLTHRT